MSHYMRDNVELRLEIKNGFLFLKKQNRIVNLNNVKEISIINIDDEVFMVEAKLNSLFTDYSVEENCKPIKVSSPESLEIETFKNRKEAEDFISIIYDTI